MDEFSAFYLLNDNRNLTRLLGSDNFQGQFGQTNSKPQGLLPGAGTSFVTCLFFLVKKRVPERKSRKRPGHIRKPWSTRKGDVRAVVLMGAAGFQNPCMDAPVTALVTIFHLQLQGCG